MAEKKKTQTPENDLQENSFFDTSTILVADNAVTEPLNDSVLQEPNTRLDNKEEETKESQSLFEQSSLKVDLSSVVSRRKKKVSVAVDEKSGKAKPTINFYHRLLIRTKSELFSKSSDCASIVASIKDERTRSGIDYCYFEHKDSSTYEEALYSAYKNFKEEKKAFVFSSSIGLFLFKNDTDMSVYGSKISESILLTLKRAGISATHEEKKGKSISAVFSNTTSLLDYLLNSDYCFTKEQPTITSFSPFNYSCIVPNRIKMHRTNKEILYTIEGFLNEATLAALKKKEKRKEIESAEAFLKYSFTLL